MTAYRNGAVLLALATVAACGSNGGGGAGSAASQIRAVGSSTVYPFAQIVAEQFVKDNAGMKSPIIESTGTGAGMKLFCAGVGGRYPDIENASRRMKKSEYDLCAKNGVTKVAEIQIGLDGMAVAESSRGQKLNLTTADLYKALAANPFGKPQTAKTWRDVNPAFPAETIKVYGPPSTSGTRDAFAELIMTKGCESDPAMKALKASNEDQFKKTCTTLREDGGWVDAGENDNLIVQKLEADPKALGVFGYSFLEENKGKLYGNTINGVAPSYETIANFRYPGARPLYIYVKGEHLAAKKGLREYVAQFAKMWGKDGAMQKRGMVVAPADVLAASAKQATALTPIDGAALK